MKENVSGYFFLNTPKMVA